MSNNRHDKKIKFLEQQMEAGKFSGQDTADYKAGKKQLQTDQLFLRKSLGTTLGGVVELINENDVQKNTVCSLSKGRVPEEKNLVIDLIGFKYGWSATNVDPSQISYSNAIFNIQDSEFDAGATATGGEVYARQIPIALQNAEYVLSCDDAILDTGRIEEMFTHNVSSDGVNGHAKNYKELFWPKLLLSGKRMRFDIKFSDSPGASPAGYHYVELVVKGLGLGRRQS